MTKLENIQVGEIVRYTAPGFKYQNDVPSGIYIVDSVVTKTITNIAGTVTHREYVFKDCSRTNNKTVWIHGGFVDRVSTGALNRRQKQILKIAIDHAPMTYGDIKEILGENSNHSKGIGASCAAISARGITEINHMVISKEINSA